MNLFGICAWLAVIVSGVLVTSNRRKARLGALFVLYLVAGLACLLSGATLLGFAIWMVGVLLGLSILLHVPIFGNRDEEPRSIAVTAQEGRRMGLANIKRFSPVIVTALVTIAAGLYGLGKDAGDAAPAAASAEASEQTDGPGIAEFSRQLVSNDWLKLELVGVLLLVAVVGAGSTSRAERIEGSADGKELNA